MEAVMTQHIVMTPEIMQGSSRIVGSKIRVMDIAEWYYTQGMTVAEILEGYPHLSEAQVFAALCFYNDNRKFVDEERRQAEERTLQLIETYGVRPALP